MTDTPETDGEWNRLACQDHPEFERNLADFARKMERERDEWQINALLKLAVKKLACMWCGEIVHAPTGYEPGTPLSEEQRGQAYREHVATCQKHPIRDVELERDEARVLCRWAFPRLRAMCHDHDATGTGWCCAEEMESHPEIFSSENADVEPPSERKANAQ